MWLSEHVKQRAEGNVAAGVLGKHWIFSLQSKYSERGTLCKDFLCFERLNVVKMFECSLIISDHGLSASVCHCSSCLLLLVSKSCSLPLKLPRWTLWKQSGPPRNEDAGQPGHLCVLFVDLPHNRASRKASCFSDMCKMSVWLHENFCCFLRDSHPIWC